MKLMKQENKMHKNDESDENQKIREVVLNLVAEAMAILLKKVKVKEDMLVYHRRKSEKDGISGLDHRSHKTEKDPHP